MHCMLMKGVLQQFEILSGVSSLQGQCQSQTVKLLCIICVFEGGFLKP